MAGGPGAAGEPASSARSLPRPRARRVPGWARRGMAPGGGGRRRAARPPARSPRPALAGPVWVPSPGPGRGRSASLPRSGGPASLVPLRAKKGPAGARRASGGGRRPRAGRPGPRQPGGDPSPPPAASSHAAPRTSARRTPAARQTCGRDPAFGKGCEAAGLGGPGGGRAGGGRRESAAPQPPPHAARSGSAARPGLQRGSRGTGGEMKPVCFFFHAAFLQELGGKKKKAKGMGVREKG